MFTTRRNLFMGNPDPQEMGAHWDHEPYLNKYVAPMGLKISQLVGFYKQVAPTVLGAM
jgi:hypothetical protein